MSLTSGAALRPKSAISSAAGVTVTCPAVAGEPLADRFALLEVPQLVGPGDVAVRVHLGHQLAHPLHPLTAPGADLLVEELRPQRLHRDPAARGGQLVDAFEQQIL